MSISPQNSENFSKKCEKCGQTAISYGLSHRHGADSIPAGAEGGTLPVMAVRVWVVGLVGVAALAACSGKSGPGADVQDDPAVAAGKTSTPKPGAPTQTGGATQSVPDDEPVTGGESVSVGGTASSNDAGAASSNDAGAGPAAAGAPADLVGITVHASATPVIHESYGTLQMQVVLTARPSAPVQVELESSDTFHASVSPAMLTFTPNNWATPQIALVKGVTDLVADGEHLVTIVTLPAVSKDPRYMSFDAADFEVSVLDDTDTGITVRPDVGLITDETGGAAVFYVVLNSMPTASVTIPFSSNDLTEGVVAPASVTFTRDGWNEPHAVTITGVDDQILDGTQPYKIVSGAAVSDDPSYAGLQPESVHVTNVDNDQ